MVEDQFESAGGNTPRPDGSPVERDGYGRYQLPPPSSSDSKVKSWTRATTFAKSASDMYGLMNWSNRMVAKGIATRDDLYALAAATSVEDKKAMDKIARDAKEAAGSSSAAGLGTALHSFTEAVDRGENPKIPAQWQPDIDAYKSLITRSGLHIPPWAIERIVCIEDYAIAGTFDRLAQATKDLTVVIDKKHRVIPAGSWVVLDVKTGKDLSYGWGDIAIQLALYSRADKVWNGSEGHYEDLPQIHQGVALVAHLPAGKGRATLYGVDIARGWAAAEMCAQIRKWRSANRYLAAKIEVGSASYEDRVRGASSRTELSKIWREASKAGAWTEELELLGKQRLDSLTE